MVVLAVSVGCQRQERADQPAEPDSLGGPSQVSFDARFVVNENGRRRAMLVAERMEHYDSERNDSTYALLRGQLKDSSRVTVFVFDARGDSSATIEADRIYYHENEERFEAYGDVIVTTPEGRRLESERLTWRQDERKIRTPTFVRITSPGEYVEGQGLVADEDLETYQIGRFSAEVEVEDE